MSYPIANVTGWSGLAVYANTVTDGVFWQLLLAVISVVVFFLMYKQSMDNPSVGLAGASFSFFLGSIFLNILGLVPGNLIAIGLALLGFSGFLLYITRD